MDRFAIVIRGMPTLLVVVVLAAFTGCRKPPPPKSAVIVNPKVHLFKLEKQAIDASIGQPSFVYAYEQTSLFPKVTGFVESWSVDIGRRVLKGQELAHIEVPELVAEFDEAKAAAALDVVDIAVKRTLVEVAASQKQVSESKAKAAEENVKKFEADVERWTSEVSRLSKITNVVDEQVIQESQKQLKSTIAARDAARADAAAAWASATARKADVDKARTDVEAAQAKAKVSAAHVRRLQALVGYTHLVAPYDGVVVDRNVNTGDYVEPTRGDLSAGRGSSNQSAGQGAPLFVVARTDKVRIFVDVPESQAAYVGPETKARVQFESQRGEEVDCSVTRTSWSLQLRTRTLRAEIDLPNPGGRLLPGMYAYAHVMIALKDVWAVPQDAVIELGEQKCIYLYDSGKAVKTPVQTGIENGKLTELYRKQVDGKWVQFNGSEQVIRGDLAELANGRAVEVENAPRK